MGTKLRIPYLLILNIPTYVDEGGARFLERLWHKDVIEHLHYIADLTICAPREHFPTELDVIRVDTDPLFEKVRFADLPPMNNVLNALLAFPRVVAIVTNEIGRACIVHSGVAGWPVAIGWIAAPIAKLRNKRLVVVVESAFWRLGQADKSPLKHKVRSWVSEHLARWCVRAADLSIFTQPEYKASLLGEHSSAGHVIPASWINDDNIISAEQAVELWREKLHTPQPLRVLFVGRLVQEKGIRVLLKAARILIEQKLPIELVIVGQGPLLEESEATAMELSANMNVSMLGTVAYGPELFELIDRFHALIIPSLGDEQPRIVFDAYARAVPVIASDTDGLRSCVRDTETGVLFPTGDAGGLAAVLQSIERNRGELSRMGFRAHKYAATLTHRTMHERRLALLQEMLTDGCPTAANKC